ncbi:MAG: F0F1 ATP synthase subunit B [Pseudomonadota bacterium]
MSTAFAQDTDGAAADPDRPRVEVPIPDSPAEVNVPISAPEESLFPPFDFAAFPSHLFWLILTFGLLYFVMNRLIVPQVGGIIEDRRDRIASDLGEASRLSRETDEVIAMYERELAEARQKAYAIAQQRRDEIKSEQERQQAETEEALNTRIVEAEKQIAARRDAALADVDAIAAEAVSAIVEQVAGITLSEAEASGAVKRKEEAGA